MIANDPDGKLQLLVWLVIIGGALIFGWIIYLLTIRGARTVRTAGMLFDSAVHSINCDGPIKGYCNTPGCRYNQNG